MATNKTYTFQDMLDTNPCNDLTQQLKDYQVRTSRTNFTLRDIYKLIPTSLGNKIWLVLSLSQLDETDLENTIGAGILKAAKKYPDKQDYAQYPEKRFISYAHTALDLTYAYPETKFHFMTDALMFLTKVDQQSFDNTMDWILKNE